MYKTLEKKILNRTAVVGVIGMGYVGLPLAVELGREGFQVIGIDIALAKIRLVNSGRSDIDDVKDKDLKPLVKAGKIKATTDFSQLKKSDVVPICVPTPLSKTKDPDVSYILAAVGEVGLSGELRAISQLERRVAEAARLGFKRCVIPKVDGKITPPKGIDIIPVSTLREAIRVGLVGGKAKEN